ncbi:MAG: hypothetical protein SCALA701_04870 [Candidatus Scalindua sp.]|nr:MAG: hypothetical protein SCALA701_04870 [Candidatus Scalindua sp.]
MVSKLPDRVLVKGQTINQYQNNKLLYTLRIGSLRISHKKIGFIKLGFLKIAQIDDLKIDYFLDDLSNYSAESPPSGGGEGNETVTPLSSVVKGDNILTPQSKGHDREQKSMMQQHATTNGATETLNNEDGGEDSSIFNYIENNPELEAMIRQHKIKGVEIEGVEITFHRGEEIVCTVSSVSARIDYKNRDFILRGNTKIVAGNRTLMAHQVNWKNSGNKFSVKGRYNLLNGDVVEKGECMQVDYLLRTIEPCSNEPGHNT